MLAHRARDLGGADLLVDPATSRLLGELFLDDSVVRRGRRDDPAVAVSILTDVPAGWLRTLGRERADDGRGRTHTLLPHDHPDDVVARVVVELLTDDQTTRVLELVDGVARPWQG